MASVDVKLGLSAAEFDLVRQSVEECKDRYIKLGKLRPDEDVTAAMIREANARATKLKDLHDKFN